MTTIREPCKIKARRENHLRAAGLLLVMWALFSGPQFLDRRITAPNTTVASTATRQEAGVWNEHVAAGSGSSRFAEVEPAGQDERERTSQPRGYTYDTRGQVLSESYAPRPGVSETLNFAFDFGLPRVGVRTKAEVGTGGNTKWFANATTVDPLSRITVASENTEPRTITATGFAAGAKKVTLTLDGNAIPDANHPGWANATGAWSAPLTLTPGVHELTAVAEHPSGFLTAPATSAFTVAGAPQTVTNTFDGAGNIANRSWSGGKSQSLTWDAFGRLAKVVQTGVEPFTWTATYDGLGRRLRTNYEPSGGASIVVNSTFDPHASRSRPSPHSAVAGYASS